MTGIAVVAWDFDGVLNRNVVDGRFAWMDDFEAETGQSREDFVAATLRRDWDPIMTGRVDLRDRLAAWADTVGYAPGPDALMAYWFAKDALPDPDMLALMDRLDGIGLRQVIATNNEPRRTAYIEREMGFAARVETVFASGRLGVRKPDRAFFDAVVEQVGVRPDEIVLIDDLARNVEAARRAGWHAVHLTDGSADTAAGHLSRLGLSIPGGH